MRAMQWTSALTTGPDLDGVLGELVDEVRRGLGTCEPDVLFVFAGRGFGARAEHIVDTLNGALAPSVLLGCTAGGVIGAGHETEDESSISLLAGCLPGVGLHPFHLGEGDLPDPDSPPHAWHEAVGVSPADAPNFLVFPDPYSFPVEQLLEGLDYAWPDAVTVGGLASGDAERGGQAVFLGDRVFKEGAVGLGLMGDIELLPAVAQGCSPLGPPMRVTACEGPLLKTLDGRPAFEALEGAVRAEDDPQRIQEGRVLLLGFEMDPLASKGDGPWLVRPLVGIDRRTNGLVIGADLRPGQRVRFHIRDASASREDLERTLDAVHLGTGVSPHAALLFSCLGRGEHLYGEPDHDSRIFRSHFGQIPVAGFFAGGEIGPVGGRTGIHGFTSAFGLIRPRSGQ